MKLETYESNLPSTKNNTCIKDTQILKETRKSSCKYCLNC